MGSSTILAPQWLTAVERLNKAQDQVFQRPIIEIVGEMKNRTCVHYYFVAQKSQLLPQVYLKKVVEVIGLAVGCRQCLCC